MVIDGGDCQVGLESTVINALCNPPVILRPGCITLEDIKNIKGFENTIVNTGNTQNEVPIAPGMKYTHYKPNCDVILFEYGQDINNAMNKEINELTSKYINIYNNNNII